MNLGIVLYRKGQVGESLTHLRQAVEFQPDDAVAHNNLAIVLSGQRQTDEAIAHFRKALQLEPDYPDAHNNLGATLAQAATFEEAAAHFQRRWNSSRTMPRPIAIWETSWPVADSSTRPSSDLNKP